jgi:hypothetical protein
MMMHSKSRLFNMVWNSAKIPNYFDRMTPQRAEGTHYANGRVSLDNGSNFETMAELSEYYSRYGSFKVVYQDAHGAQDLMLDDVSNEPSRIPARSRIFRSTKPSHSTLQV